MNIRTSIILLSLSLLAFQKASFGQTPNLRTANSFILFSSNGALSNTGNSILTGNVGTNKGSSTAFGNVNGIMHDQDAASAQSVTDLQKACLHIDSITNTNTSSSLLGKGDTLLPGVYAVGTAASLSGNLYLNAKGNANAVFIFKIKGALSVAAFSKIKLINGTTACNVFWKAEGKVNVATGASLKGTFIANVGAIVMSTGDSLEGRALSTTGAITVDGLYAFMPTGCNGTYLTGPPAPDLGSASCYAIFSASGTVANTGTTTVLGDVGSNSGTTTGFQKANVTGTIHDKPDASTALCAADLKKAYNKLDSLAYDIKLLFPARFGRNLVLTPHTYLLDAATVLTDSLYINAEGHSNAIFVIQINGALTTTTYSRVILMNGAQSKNIYWKIEGAASINNYSIFRGNIICNNAALGVINTGVVIDGRAFTTKGALTTTAVKVSIPSACTFTGVTEETNSTDNTISLFPNPFTTSINIEFKDLPGNENTVIKIYNTAGQEVIQSKITSQDFSLETGLLSSGIYFYRISNDSQILKSGKLISRK